MIAAVEQPYFLPYIGYWQLLNAVDIFLILDDVNYIRRGYINRNSILLNGGAYRFSIPVKNASQERKIMDTALCLEEREKQRFLLRIELAYKKAPQFSQVYPLIRDIIYNPQDDLTDFIQYSLRSVAAYLGITTKVIRSSALDKDNSLKGQERVMEICKCINADTYINPPGGRKLYNKQFFHDKNVELFFLDTRHENIVYPQFGNPFVEKLSLIDVMMFNSIEKIQYFLKEYDLNE